MESQDIDAQATSMEMKRDNVHLYLLAGKQAVRIDMLENALNLSESNREGMSQEMGKMQAYIQELEARMDGAKPEVAVPGEEADNA